ncbi:MAG: type I-U CRISPR-associated RAMP protein Csb1/Cas7u [Bifidobacteriaceae bacterium]|nr:type I-U CRISPR-associated RAMP protein Csb1/Cas7u [Bifidobacteriaceae bacterium]
MGNNLTLEDLNEAAKIGGPATLTQRTELQPASGPDGVVAPAKYTDRSGNGTYVVEDCFIDNEPQKTVLLDSRTSSSNRLEDFITKAIKDERGILGKMPHIKVTYKDGERERVFFDTQLPHRAFDGHIRIGSTASGLVSADETYISARNSDADNMMPLFLLSPDTIALGAWDSTRNKNQLRIASSFNGEVFGVLANQNDDPKTTFIHRAGARVDPVEASIKFTGNDVKSIADIVSGDISDNLKQSFVKGGKKGAGSKLGLGAIPPSVANDTLDGVAVRSIVRTQVISFATLRALRFGLAPEGDAAIRTLLFATLIDAMVGSNRDGANLRANCLLTETSEPQTLIDRRYGKFDELDRITLDAADELLEQAYKQAHDLAGIDWSGQTFEVIGNPIVIASGTADDDSSDD